MNKNKLFVILDTLDTHHPSGAWKHLLLLIVEYDCYTSYHFQSLQLIDLPYTQRFFDYQDVQVMWLIDQEFPSVGHLGHASHQTSLMDYMETLAICYAKFLQAKTRPDALINMTKLIHLFYHSEAQVVSCSQMAYRAHSLDHKNNYKRKSVTQHPLLALLLWCFVFHWSPSLFDFRGEIVLDSQERESIYTFIKRFSCMDLWKSIFYRESASALQCIFSDYWAKHRPYLHLKDSLDNSLQWMIRTFNQISCKLCLEYDKKNIFLSSTQG